MTVAGGGFPRTVSRPWAEALLDLRSNVEEPLVRLDGPPTHRAQYGEVVIEGLRTNRFDHIVTISLDRHTVAVAVSLLDRSNYPGNSLFGWLMPGLIGVPFGELFWSGENEYFWQFEESLTGKAEFEERLNRVTASGATCLHRVLSDTTGWPDTCGDEGEDVDVESSMLRWASVGVCDAVEAGRWEEVGVDPEQLTYWRLEGWEDREIARWAPVGCDQLWAHSYRVAGFSPAEAALWWRNAHKVHPSTSAVLRALGPWTATSAAGLRRALAESRTSLDFADPWAPQSLPSETEGDELLIQWARIKGLSPREAVNCVRAGLSPTETAALLQNGPLDVAALTMMARLRRRGH